MPSGDEARALLDTAAVALLEPLRKEFHKLMGEWVMLWLLWLWLWLLL